MLNTEGAKLFRQRILSGAFIPWCITVVVKINNKALVVNKNIDVLFWPF